MRLAVDTLTAAELEMLARVRPAEERPVDCARFALGGLIALEFAPREVTQLAGGFGWTGYLRERGFDPAREVDARDDLPDDLAAMVRAQARELEAIGVTGDRAAELLAHAATECARGARAIGHNYGGIKAKERDNAAAVAKTGVGLRWWRDHGHAGSGDGAVVYYRAFEDDGEFWRFFVKRFVGGPSQPPESARYAAAGRAFWGADPSRWFVELVLAGYRGEVRERELEELDARGAAEEHPSVKGHRDVARRVRMLLRDT